MGNGKDYISLYKQPLDPTDPHQAPPGVLVYDLGETFREPKMAKYPDWMYRQSAVLPYRLRQGVPEVLLITSRKGTRWVLPKGVIEPELTPSESAAKEALEEAGIEGEVIEPEIGQYSYRKWGGVCKVQVFLMKVTTELDTWPEDDMRHREWFPVGVAAERVNERELRNLIGGAPHAIVGYAGSGEGS